MIVNLRTPCQPGDVYRDARGDLWVVQRYCAEPSVEMLRVYSDGVRPDPEERRAGVSGLLWQGFKKIAEEKATGSKRK